MLAKQGLPGALNLKGTESGGFGFRKLVLDDLVDARAARALLQLGPQVGKVLGWAARDDFDIARIGITHPAMQPERRRFAVHEPAKAHTLHSSANKKVKNHANVQFRRGKSPAQPALKVQPAAMP